MLDRAALYRNRTARTFSRQVSRPFLRFARTQQAALVFEPMPMLISLRIRARQHPPPPGAFLNTQRSAGGADCYFQLLTHPL